MLQHFKDLDFFLFLGFSILYLVPIQKKNFCTKVSIKRKSSTSPRKRAFCVNQFSVGNKIPEISNLKEKIFDLVYNIKNFNPL